MNTMNTQIDWGKLHDAYGTAEEVSGLILSVKNNPNPLTSADQEQWNSLWSRLCHQGTVYSASYAAFVELVSFAMRTDGQINHNFFLLPVCIEIGRVRGGGTEIPENLQSAYQESLKILGATVSKHINDDGDLSLARSLCAAYLVSRGFHDIASKIIDQDE